MRFAITVMARTGTIPTSTEGSKYGRNILTDLRDLQAELEGLDIRYKSDLGKEFGKKIEVMQQSVQKVEKALYERTVRGAERPAGWVPDVSGKESRNDE